ncbi:helix-turn-helix domain-containing protein [Flavobacterium difficile]|uniref:Helix-turn-helix transcriptional regulator n=1 Tax=Flavobacterium difficile TaxID=2709659 RepID=A0ABX0I000_9FLAO|nr:AraC family transcriptional regulator [Flavobacterium difficile]NHM00525.1 helix-turn-helix transcriptional regulator [Flavobacterium difficile]
MSKFLKIVLFYFIFLPITILSQNVKHKLDYKSFDELWISFFENDKTNRIKYAETYLKKAKKENLDLEIGRGLYLYAYNCLEINNSKAVYYYNKSLKFAKKSKDNNIIVKIYFDISGIKSRQFKYKEAIDNLILAEKYNNDSDYEYIIKLNIAIIKSENLGEIEQALKLYKKCHNYYISKGVRLTKYNGYYKEILFDIADAYKAKKAIDSSSFYNKLGYEEAKYSNDEEMLSLFILNEGANQVIKKNYTAAFDSVMKALPVLKKFNNQSNILASYFYLGKIHEGLGNKKKAVENFKKVDSLYEKNKDITPEFISGYHYLISYYKSNGDNVNQLKYINSLMKIDSTFQKNYKEIYKTIQEKYEIPILFKEKEKLINNLEQKSLLFYISFFLLIALVVFLVYKQFKLKKLYKNRYKEIMDTDSEKNKILFDSNKEKSLNNTGISQDIVLQILEKLDHFEKTKGFLNSNISINLLSIEFNTNTKYLSKIINEYKEKSFINYINDLRIEYSLKQLKSNPILRKYTITALTKEFGFNSSESFTSAFYKKTKIKPTFFIKELNKNTSDFQ